jgi:HEPN domain-containing protein
LIVDWSSAAVALPSAEHARRFYRVAKQRFDDALLLLEMGRTTAAVYLAGYSVECMLKALILSAIPQAQEEEVLSMFRGARAHDYEWLLRLYVEKGGSRMPPSVVPHFARVNSWSTDMRYLPGTLALREAHAFVDAATAILTWIDGRL